MALSSSPPICHAETLTEWLDPSVTDELDPDRRELVAFDIYDSACPHQPPYTDEFVQRFRAAQIARNRKITEWCQERLDTLRRRETSEVERCFVVHRTMCDVRWLDPSIDPNGRRPGWCYLGDPRRQHLTRRARAIFVAAFLALAVEL